MKVLIVEDESIIAYQYQILLRAAGSSEVVICSYGEDAVRLADEFRPDLILMDYSLKGKKNGLEAGKEIREKHDIPILFITAFANRIKAEDKPNCEDIFFLDKPVNKKLLLDCVEQIKAARLIYK